MVTLHTLLKNGNVPKSSGIFVIHDSSLGMKSRGRIQKFASEHARSVAFLNAAGRIPAGLPLSPSDHVTEATFFRLFAATLLPPDITSVLYLDCDLLVRQDIGGLLEVPVSSPVAAADHLSPPDEIRLWGPLGGAYFQAGVLIINLDSWRANEADANFVQIAHRERHRIRWWDQDILNLAFANAWERLEIWNNVGFRVVETFPKEVVDRCARIVHFDGADKPWVIDKPRAFRDEWFREYRDVFGRPFDMRRVRQPLIRRGLVAIVRRLRRFLGTAKPTMRGTRGG